MSTVDLNDRIPNNVDLASDRRLRRALEQWQPAFLDWWREMGPVAGAVPEVYLRTATSVDRSGWANFGYTLGCLSRRSGARPAHRLRRPQGRAGLATRAGRLPGGAPQAHRDPG